MLKALNNHEVAHSDKVCALQLEAYVVGRKLPGGRSPAVAQGGAQLQLERDCKPPRQDPDRRALHRRCLPGVGLRSAVS